MISSLHVERLHTLEQVRAFLDGNGAVDFEPSTREEAYGFVERMLARFDYADLGKNDKGLVKRFPAKATGLFLVSQCPGGCCDYPVQFAEFMKAQRRSGRAVSPSVSVRSSRDGCRFYRLRMRFQSLRRGRSQMSFFGLS